MPHVSRGQAGDIHLEDNLCPTLSRTPKGDFNFVDDFEAIHLHPLMDDMVLTDDKGQYRIDHHVHWAAIPSREHLPLTIPRVFLFSLCFIPS